MRKHLCFHYKSGPFHFWPIAAWRCKWFNKTYSQRHDYIHQNRKLCFSFLYLRKTMMKLWLSSMTHSPKPMITAPKIYRAKKHAWTNKHDGHVAWVFVSFWTRLVPHSLILVWTVTGIMDENTDCASINIPQIIAKERQQLSTELSSHAFRPQSSKLMDPRCPLNELDQRSLIWVWRLLCHCGEGSRKTPGYCTIKGRIRETHTLFISLWPFITCLAEGCSNATEIRVMLPHWA